MLCIFIFTYCFHAFENKQAVDFKDFFNVLLFYFFRERRREGEREREKHECVRKTSIGCFSYAPHLGTKPATQVCVLTRNQTSDLLLCGTTPSQLSHIGQGQTVHFNQNRIMSRRFLNGPPDSLPSKPMIRWWEHWDLLFSPRHLFLPTAGLSLSHERNLPAFLRVSSQ